MTLLRSSLLVATTLAILLVGCDSTDPGSGGPGIGDASIGAFIEGLSYDAEALLNVQPNDTAREISGDPETETEQVGTETLTCVATTYDLQNNFDEIAILRPTSDVIWPGALVEANQGLLDGLPEPARFARAPVKIRIDLPGIGAEGVKTVADPDAGNMQVAIDEALEWWNANAYREGYVNASSSSNKVTTSYSSKQASLDLGLNVEWASGDVQSQFGFETSETRRVVFASYKQAFYTASYVVENGQQPEDVFAPSVSLPQVEAAFNSSTPPAYVSSVTYGRIILFRMETSSSYTAADVETAFSYAAGAQVDGSLVATYEEILANSSVEVVTLGGNAAVASDAVTARSAGDLVPIIRGENAVYSRNNPGVPIAYTVKFLKDDRLAKLGYTTQYVARECSSAQTRDTVRITLLRYRAVRDCDSGPGDFEFDVDVFNGSTRVGGNSAGQEGNEIELSDGDTQPIRNAEFVFDAERRNGNTFSVKFNAKEWDDPPFGPPNTNDLNRSTTSTHRFGSTGWTNLADDPGVPIVVEVRKDASCVVQLDYTAEVL